MRSLNSTDDDNEDDAKSMFHWWRSAGEFDEGGRIKIDNISNLTPRLKILREFERLALVAADSLDDLRHKLVSYRSGDFWIPVGGIRKEDLDIPPLVTILLVGFSGSGKSSLVNLMYSVLGRSSLIPFAQTSGNPCNHTTMYMEEHNVLRSVRSGFCVYDSRGLDYKRKTESLEGLKEWVEDGIHHHQLCSLPSDDVGLDLPTYSSSKFVQRRVNCTVVVANVAEIYRALMTGDSKPLEATRDLFNSPAISNFNENPILILTHGDILSTEERLDGRQKICQFLGVSETTGAYDIACITEHGFLADESDPMTAYALTEAVYRALLFSDRTHPPKKSVKDRLLEWPLWIMCAIAAFFAFLAHCFSKMGKKERKHKVY